MSKNEPTIASPCVGVCDVFDGLCMGCFRDIHEITDWHDLDDESRSKVLEEAAKRRKAMNEAG